MQVVFHLGAPCTDGDMLSGSLQKNRLRLAQAGIAVPPPARYRPMLRDTARALKGQPASHDMQNALLDSILDLDEVDRLILSDPRFVCINRLVVRGAQIWPGIARTCSELRALFPMAEVEFFIGMRDPATLIPALFKASRFTDFAEFTENMQPHAVAWSEMLRRLCESQRDCRVVVWCNEDTPLLWGDILRSLAGLAPGAELDAVDDLAASIMEPEGSARMRDWLARNPPETTAQRRRVIAAFLERYALPAAIEETVNLPGWSEALMAEMSARYDADLAEIAAIPGVTLLAP